MCFSLFYNRPANQNVDLRLFLLSKLLIENFLFQINLRFLDFWIIRYNSHFWYLYFIGIILSPKVMPGSWWSSWGWITADWCCWTVLTSVYAYVTTLKTCNRHGDNTIVETDRLTQFRVIKWLLVEETKKDNWKLKTKIEAKYFCCNSLFAKKVFYVVNLSWSAS